MPNATQPVEIVHPTDPTQRKRIRSDTRSEDLLVPVVRDGKSVYRAPTLAQVRERVQQELASFHPTVRRILYPHGYPAGLEGRLHELRTDLILAARGAR